MAIYNDADLKIHVALGEVYSVAVQGKDDGHITYKIVSGRNVSITDGENDNVKNVTFTIEDEDESPIRYDILC